MYYEVHRMHREGYSISKINHFLSLHKNTIRKYFSMKEADYEALLINQSERKKELDSYEDFVNKSSCFTRKHRLLKRMTVERASQHLSNSKY